MTKAHSDQIALHAITGILISLLISACKEPGQIYQNNDTWEDANVVASQGQKALTRAELDTHVAVALHDLEWQKYAVRKKALQAISAEWQKNDARTPVQWVLNPPEPPRLPIEHDPRPTQGSPTAPVNLSVFCSLQSSHCARLQPTLSALQSHYGDQLSLTTVDVPQGYHRYARAAANAVHCAAEQGFRWDFLRNVYAAIDDLSKNRFDTIAEQLGMQQHQLRQCMESKPHDKRIDADLAYAARLGIKQVPTVLVNGLYIKGEQSVDHYRFYINAELQRLGKGQFNTAALDPQHSEPPTDDSAKDAMFEAAEAMIEVEDAPAQGENDGQDNHATQEDRPASPSQSRTLPPTTPATLSRDWLDEQLLNKPQLEKHFQAAEHVVEGVRLLKLDEVSQNRFYQTLNLQTGDVIMRINDEWVHEQNNPLWDRLADNQPMTILLMRQGFPVRYDFQIR